MRAVVQRVKRSNVKVNGQIIGEIDKGINLLLGIKKGDTFEDLKYLAEKIVNLRIFEDSDEKMNLSLVDKKYDLLIIPQFTLLGDCRKGRRPSFFESANPEMARKFYKDFINYIKKNYDISVQTGEFGAHMDVDIQNDGPVTLLIDSEKEF